MISATKTIHQKWKLKKKKIVGKKYALMLLPTCSTILSVGTLLRLPVELAAAAAPWADVHRHNSRVPLASTLQKTVGNKQQEQAVLRRMARI